MLTCLDDEDVKMMLESTFSTIIQRWEDFAEAIQRRAAESLEYLLKHRNHLIREMIDNIPSLARFAQLSEIEKQLNKLRVHTDIGQTFQTFSRRVSHENSGVAAQSLVELKAYLRLHQSFLQASAVSEQPDIVVGQLVRSILDTCVKFNESHHDIAQLSAECIGLIGCLDSNRVESVREQRDMVVVNNFYDPGETTDFVLFLLEEVIVKAFLSATDTGLQGFLSFVMQELLEKCDFREACASNSNRRSADNTNANDVYRKWLALPGNVQATLTPFLTSRYFLPDMAKAKTEYPIFRPDQSRPDKVYNMWLRAFVLDLLQKPLNLNAELIFAPLCRAIRIKDVSVASFLLPYVVLHVIVEGTDQHREEIGGELLRVLQYQISTDSHLKKEDLKSCSEVSLRIIHHVTSSLLKHNIAGRISCA
jgi:serine/threonine-protein kinase ATR